MLPIIIGTVMSFDDPKRFKRFTHLVPPRFNDVVDEDAYEFLINYRDKLHNLGLLELHKVTYTTY